MNRGADFLRRNAPPEIFSPVIVRVFSGHVATPTSILPRIPATPKVRETDVRWGQAKTLPQKHSALPPFKDKIYDLPRESNFGGRIVILLRRLWKSRKLATTGVAETIQTDTASSC